MSTSCASSSGAEGMNRTAKCVCPFSGASSPDRNPLLASLSSSSSPKPVAPAAAAVAAAGAAAATGAAAAAGAAQQQPQQQPQQPLPHPLLRLLLLAFPPSRAAPRPVCALGVLLRLQRLSAGPLEGPSSGRCPQT